MNDRQRFLATMQYKPRDRAPICDFGFWPETITAWHDQGLPLSVQGGHDTTTNQFFGMDVFTGGLSPDVGLNPFFEEKTLEDRGDTIVVQNADGAAIVQAKDPTIISIPPHESHLLTDRASWTEHYKHRLDPDTPGRDPDWAAAQAIWNDPDYPAPRTLSGGSLYGWIRNWMGMEGVSYLVFDDPALFEEMVVTIADLIVECHRRAFEHGAQIDACSMWEDMCFNSGPLLSPDDFKKYLVPQYKRITEQLRSHGCNITFVDCDGCIDQLIPLWFEAGVNCMFPIEIGNWGADPIRYRKQYGKDLLLLGGYDKHILAQSKKAIADEIDRLTPLVEEGGFIPFCDHRVPPDVPLTNYMFYLETAREKWGQGVNLKPMATLT